MRDEIAQRPDSVGAERRCRDIRNETAPRLRPSGTGRIRSGAGPVGAADLDREIRRLAGLDWDVVGREQLLEFGASRHQIWRRLRSGALVMIHPGVYAVGHDSLSRRGRELAAVRSLGESAWLSDRAATALWGLIDPVEVIEVAVIAKRTPRRAGVRVRRVGRALPQTDRRVRHRIPVTSPLRTLLDVAADPAFADLELAVARALKRGLVSKDALEARLETERGRPGTPRLRTVLGQTGGPRFTRSALERRFLERLRAAELRVPRTEVRWGPYILDFLWPEERVVVETDGFDTHGTESAFHADRARDAELTSRGYDVLRFTWRQIDAEPTLVIARLAAVLAIAGERARAATPTPRAGSARDLT